MKPLSFVGKLPASKSMLIRWWLVKSYHSTLRIRGESGSEDVTRMRECVERLGSGQELPVGQAASVLRFMAVRASRLPGQHVLRGSKRLFERPHDELGKVLKQLGVESEFGDDFLRLESAGWKLHGDTLLVPSHRSSQYLSAVLLNAWDLPFELFVSPTGQRVSEGYWRMSVQMAQQAGMKIDFWDSDFRVPRGQRPAAEEVTAEIDLSSAFALAAVAAVSGRATFLDFPENSLQPDFQFVNILDKMGVPIRRERGTLSVDKAPRLNGVMVNLRSSPDMFPVLAALCALCEGESELFGAPHLVHKESDRLGRMVEWIQTLGREVEVKDDGLKIRAGRSLARDVALRCDCDHDHRLAFAAAVWLAAGLNIEIADRNVVNKSFPDFWGALGW